MRSCEDRIYLDNAATTAVYEEVFDAMRPYFCGVYGNPSSQHAFGRSAAEAVTRSRDKMAVALNIYPDELYFTGCGTEADNLGIKGVALANADRGRHIAVSAIEHHAVLNSAAYLAANGFKVDYIFPDSRGVVTAQAVKKVMRGDTVLVAVMSANNETGVIQPVGEIYDVVRSGGAFLWCDCVQSAGVLPMSMFPCDGFALSAHKFGGPKGVGAACIKRGVRFAAQMSGGHQERGMRGGTLNVPGIVGMARALELSIERSAACASSAAALRDEFESLVLGGIEGASLNGGADRLAGHSNISFSGCDGQNIVMLLDMRGVAASAGAACAAGASSPSHVIKAMGADEGRVRSAVRFSFGAGNTRDDVTAAYAELKEVVAAIRRANR